VREQTVQWTNQVSHGLPLQDHEPSSESLDYLILFHPFLDFESILLKDSDATIVSYEGAAYNMPAVHARYCPLVHQRVNCVTHDPSAVMAGNKEISDSPNYPRITNGPFVVFFFECRFGIPIKLVWSKELSIVHSPYTNVADEELGAVVFNLSQVSDWTAICDS